MTRWKEAKLWLAQRPTPIMTPTMTVILQELSSTVSSSARKRSALKIHAKLARGYPIADVYLYSLRQIENDLNYD